MKKGLLLLSLIIFAFACQKSPEQRIIGKWKIEQTTFAGLDDYMNNFKDSLNASEEEINAEKSRLAGILKLYYPKGVIMEFADSNRYYMGGVPGHWYYDPDSKILKISFNRLDTAKFYVKKITKSDLILDYQTSFSKIPLTIEIQLKRIKENK